MVEYLTPYSEFNSNEKAEVHRFFSLFFCCLLCTHALPLLRYFLLEVNTKPCVSFTKQYTQREHKQQRIRETHTHTQAQKHTQPYVCLKLNAFSMVEICVSMREATNAHTTQPKLTANAEAIPVYVYARMRLVFIMPTIRFVSYHSFDGCVFTRRSEFPLSCANNPVSGCVSITAISRKIRFCFWQRIENIFLFSSSEAKQFKNLANKSNSPQLLSNKMPQM